MDKTSNQKPIILNITALGGMGDGIAEYNGETIYLPLTCPGDEVEAIINSEHKTPSQGTVTRIMTPSADRKAPPCEYFGTCGGCSLQHLNTTTYNHFKQSILSHMMTELNPDPSVITPMIEIGPHSRRRAEFKISVKKGKINIGFFARKSHDVVDIKKCPISDNRLTELLAPLKICLQTLKKPGLLKAIHVCALDKGLDTTIITRSPLNNKDRQILTAFAKAHNILRLHEHTQTPQASHTSPSSEDSTCLHDSEDATIDFSGVEVALPLGAFLQATHTGQQAISGLVANHLQHKNKIADLYAGCGTYSFELIKHAKSITAYEGVQEMTLAMHNAMIHHKLENKLTSHTRDLYKHPLTQEELNRFDGVVINPPRNGASTQAKQLAHSTVSSIVMVSCNPATFKRDAQTLIKGGYHLTQATAIDQFYWSGHLELVACFEKQ